MTGVDRKLEGIVQAEMRRLSRRRERSKAGSRRPPAVVRRVHQRQRVLARMARVADAVPVLRRHAARLLDVRLPLIGLPAAERVLADGVAPVRTPGQHELSR
jgi:hypothetical protein